MGVIQETFTLKDQFSNTMTRFLNLIERASGQTGAAKAAADTYANSQRMAGVSSQAAAMSMQNYNSAANAVGQQLIRLNAQFDALMGEQNAMIASGQQNTAAFSQLDQAMERVGGKIRMLEGQSGALASRMGAMGTSAAQAAEAQERLNQKMTSGASASGSLEGRIRSLVGAYLSLQGLKSVLNLSDTMTQTTARLDRMNDGLQSTAELNEMIFQSAMRSRGAYQDTANMVSKLGTLAGDAFSGSAEIVAFAEQINKQMVLSGTSTMEAKAAMLQLTQAMSSGVLRGDELRSIMEQTPMIAQSVADYMGVSTGKMRELAAEGQVTAEIVKAAMFSVAEETNAAFESMPMTWAQVWTQAQNMMIRALQPVLDGISWLANHLEELEPILTRVAAGAVVAAVGIGAYTFATWIATGAAQAFTAALLANPITWIVAGVMLLVLALYAGVDAFNEFSGASVSATGIIAGAFLALGAQILNMTIIPAQNAFAHFANFLGNLFNDPVAAVKILFLDMATTLLGYIKNVAHGIEGLINAIPGMSVNLTSGIDSLYNTVKGAAQSAKDASGWTEYVKPWEFIDLVGAYNTGYNWGAEFNPFGGMGGVGEGFDYAALSADIGDIATGVGNIERSVSMADEDIKSLVDMAERRYVNNVNLTAQTPIITVQGQNTGDTAADRQNLANALRDILLEQASSGSVRSTQKPT